MADFTHFDESGASRMVDVAGKEVTLRTARASGYSGSNRQRWRWFWIGGWARVMFWRSLGWLESWQPSGQVN